MQCAKVPTDLFFSTQSCWLCLSYLKAYKSHTSAGWLFLLHLMEAKAKQKIILDSVYFDESFLRIRASPFRALWSCGDMCAVFAMR